MLTLTCWMIGDDPERTFSIDILVTKTVDSLKELIRAKNPSSLASVDVKDIDLWKVSFPVDDLEKDLGDLDLSRHQRLSPSAHKLTKFFTDVEDNCLHIIARAPKIKSAVAPDSMPLLSLNCSIIGDGPDRNFVVKIPKAETVSILKELIRDKNPSSLANVDVKDIDLWRVSFPIDDLPAKASTKFGPKLRAEKLLSDVFPNVLDINHIHVIALVPEKGAPSPSSRPSPSAYQFPILTIDEIRPSRENFCQRRKPAAPSNGGEPPMFVKDQGVECIPCNRPYNSPAALPLSLLHPIFGQFVDDAENYVPTSDDPAFFFKFVEAMVAIYNLEKERMEAVLKVFQESDMDVKRTGIGNYTTDGDMSYDKFRFAFFEFKNEVGSKGAEPFFQAILYYLEATRGFAAQHSDSVLPSIIVLIFGPYIAFAGAAWTDRPTVQMLSPAIPCHFHGTDIKMANMLMRHLGAFRCATDSLRTYYQQYNSNPPSLLLHAIHPHPTSFTSSDGAVKHFTYLFHMKGRNLFFGRMDGTAICIKFVTSYCEEGHKFLASKHFAPKLHAIERIPGGLYMVIMDDVSEEYVSLFDLIQGNVHLLSEEHLSSRNLLSENVRKCLEDFHQANFVHGDIRNTNLMVKKSSFDGGSFLMVDYDSCGEIGQVRYPLNLNTKTVTRPAGAIGGAVIEAKHDLEMLDYIWNV